MRDTDQDWKHYGELEPYYGVLTHERFLRANLTPEVLEEFWQTGRDDISITWNNLVRLFGERPIRSALDFGCGVGRLTRAIGEIADNAVGVDVSPAMIAEGQEHSLPNVEFTTELPSGPFDWINSSIVFQHIPPKRGLVFFKDLLDRADESAFLSIHFTFFKDGRALNSHGIEAIQFGTWDGEVIRPTLMKETEQRMMMYDYDLNKIYAMLIANNFTDVHLTHTDHAGARGAVIYAGRAGR